MTPLFNASTVSTNMTLADYQGVKRLITSLVQLLILLSRTSREALATPQPASKKAGSDGWTLIWNDEFNTLDTKVWKHDEGNGQEINLPGWGNNELEYYTSRPKNVYVANGKLVLQALQETYKGFGWTSGKLTTKGTRAFYPGMKAAKKAMKTIRIEAHVKLPKGQGLWPAFWMLPANGRCHACGAYGPWPESGEIDILESVNGMQYANGVVHSGKVGGLLSKAGRYPRPKTLSDGQFHTFAIEWAANSIRWYLDGVNYHTAWPRSLNDVGWYTGNSYGAKTNAASPFDKAFYLILNLAVGGEWPGPPDATTKFPAQLVVDWVRVWGSTLDGA